jgi:hypothetical protein
MSTQTTTLPNKAELEGRNIATLKKNASDLHIAGAHKFNKADLIKAVLKAQKKAANAAAKGTATTDKPAATPKPAAAAAPAKEAFVMNAEQKKILKNDKLSKSDKFRALSEAGVPTAVIAREVPGENGKKTPYSFVFSALKRKQLVATA